MMESVTDKIYDAALEVIDEVRYKIVTSRTIFVYENKTLSIEDKITAQTLCLITALVDWTAKIPFVIISVWSTSIFLTALFGPFVPMYSI